MDTRNGIEKRIVARGTQLPYAAILANVESFVIIFKGKLRISQLYILSGKVNLTRRFPVAFLTCRIRTHNPCVINSHTEPLHNVTRNYDLDASRCECISFFIRTRFIRALRLDLPKNKNKARTCSKIYAIYEQKNFSNSGL